MYKVHRDATIWIVLNQGSILLEHLDDLEPEVPALDVYRILFQHTGTPLELPHIGGLISPTLA